MNRRSKAGLFLIIGAITFWLSWFLMPTPGTTDTIHILKEVKESRTEVLFSVILQIVSSVTLVAGLFLTCEFSFPAPRLTLIGICLTGIGLLGYCADAFFHLLAYYMTDESVVIQDNVIRIMDFMQHDALFFLIPIFIPFFIGSMIWAIGLRKQQMISKIPEQLFGATFFLGLLAVIITNTITEYKGPILSLTILAIFASGYTQIGLEQFRTQRKLRR